MCYCLIFNNNCTGVHVIDAIEGVYVGNANDAKTIMNRVIRKGLYRNFREIIQLSKAKY